MRFKSGVLNISLQDNTIAIPCIQFAHRFNAFKVKINIRTLQGWVVGGNNCRWDHAKHFKIFFFFSEDNDLSCHVSDSLKMATTVIYLKRCIMLVGMRKKNVQQMVTKLRMTGSNAPRDRPFYQSTVTKLKLILNLKADF